jgi:hypothetical protein
LPSSSIHTTDGVVQAVLLGHRVVGVDQHREIRFRRLANRGVIGGVVERDGDDLEVRQLFCRACHAGRS